MCGAHPTAHAIAATHRLDLTARSPDAEQSTTVLRAIRGRST